MDHRVLRELLRNLQLFEALFETEGVDTLYGPDGESYCLFDLQRLYGCRFHLSQRQRQAVELFLYQDLREREVALSMGVSPANPVAIYATQGLRRLAQIYDNGFEVPWGEGNGSTPGESDAAPARGVPRAGRQGRRADSLVA
jgi:DNA-directed RNA polymerase specialized sigma24 family protein